MPYISGFDRNQLMCCSWDAFVDEESIARIIDAFVEHLDIKKYGVKAVAVEGRPAYDPKNLYKLYIYGSRKGIRSSRKLAESCKVNLEVKRILNGMDRQEEAEESPGELTREDLEAKLKEAQERLARYEGYQKIME